MDLFQVFNWINQALKTGDLSRGDRALLEEAQARVWEQLRQSPDFLGEMLVGGQRQIPGSEGAGVFIQPQQTPATWIRSFVPNTSWADRMIIDASKFPQVWYGGI